MSNYSIRDLEQLSGIKAHTLRIWEQRYGILNPDRTDTNIRTYNDNDLKLVLNIALLKDHDHKISKISKMGLTEMSEEVMKISDKFLNYPDQIHSLTISMLDLDEERFEQIIDTNTKQFGFENMMINIIYPFLSRIGSLWITGSIGPAQEHFMSNLIRQKLIVAIAGLPATLRPDHKKILLFLPEGEWHEIGLLFAHYIFKSRKNKVIYLGQSLPFNEVEFACNHHHPDHIFVLITTVPGMDEIQHYVNKLCSRFPETKILLTGYQVVGQDIETPENCQIINNVRELLEVS